MNSDAVLQTHDCTPAFDCGWLAASHGADWRDNPFAARSMNWFSWSAGWNVRIAELKAAKAGGNKR